MYFDDLAQSIDAFSKLPMDADPEKLRDEAEGMLGLLFQECMKVREASNDYPRNPIRGDVWFRGSEIGLIAENLAIALNVVFSTSKSTPTRRGARRFSRCKVTTTTWSDRR